MILEIVKYGAPVLRQKGEKITRIDDDLRELAENMLETMREANGVGLAAQQVGVPVQLTVIDVGGSEDRPSELRIDGRAVRVEERMPMVLINPVLELGRDREAGVEGCLSFPEITADIDRAISVKARATTLDGGKLEFEASGLLARALQHEVDHLNGILFIDRMNPAAKAGLAGRLKRMKREWQQA